MERFIRFLVHKWLKGRGSPQDQENRTALGELEGWLGGTLNLLLGVGKIILGVTLQSAGLISDAVHTLGDLGASVVVIVGFRGSKKPADPEHPFGHQRSEHIATLVIAVLLVIAGFEVGKESVHTLLKDAHHGAELLLTWPMLLVLVSLIVLKEMVARISLALGKVIDSSALKADAWHHRTDAMRTAVVIVGLWGRNLGLPWLDSVAAIAVSALIVGTGLKMAYGSFSPLLGETVPPEALELIGRLAREVPNVGDAHDIRVQRYGTFNITTIHVELSDRLGVHKMHEITVQVEARILEHFPGECVVHIDPVDYHHPLFQQVSGTLREAVIEHPDLVDFHDLHLWGENGLDQGDVEISVEPSAFDRDSVALSEYVMQRVVRRFPDLRMEIHLKVDFSATRLGL